MKRGKAKVQKIAKMARGFNLKLKKRACKGMANINKMVCKCKLIKARKSQNINLTTKMQS